MPLISSNNAIISTALWASLAGAVTTAVFILCRNRVKSFNNRSKARLYILAGLKKVKSDLKHEKFDFDNSDNRGSWNEKPAILSASEGLEPLRTGLEDDSWEIIGRLTPGEIESIQMLRGNINYSNILFERSKQVIDEALQEVFDKMEEDEDEYNLSDVDELRSDLIDDRRSIIFNNHVGYVETAMEQIVEAQNAENAVYRYYDRYIGFNRTKKIRDIWSEGLGKGLISEEHKNFLSDMAEKYLDEEEYEDLPLRAQILF